MSLDENNILNDNNNQIISIISLSSQEYLILKSLENFYNIPSNYNIFSLIIKSNNYISIRLIDYFITKYSKQNKICYKIIKNNIIDQNYDNNDESTFYVHASYKQQLKLYQKKYFDPFSRGDRIPYFINNNYIITTIGQLNFYRWLISNNIYVYILHNKKDIEREMNIDNKFTKENKKPKNTKKKIKNSKTIINNTNTYQMQNIESKKSTDIIVNFI